MTVDSIEPSLVLVISPPRSGSTMLMRMLSGHPLIYSRPEPHLFGPLAHLGYFETVEKAPYDQFQAAEAMRGLVADLPRGEEDYLDACRAYADTLYTRVLTAKGRGKPLFVDKTPANALVLPFLTKLYPKARYLVLTRHPAAVWSSYANSFFDGDYEAARRFNPILSRYVPAIAALIRSNSVPVLTLRYEEVVQRPSEEMARVCGFLGIEFDERMVNYGEQQFEGKGFGDPLNVDRHSKPVTSSIAGWAPEFAADPAKRRMVDEMLASVEDADLETWGWPRAALWDELRSAGGSVVATRPQWNSFLVQRRLLRWLRRDIQNNSFGKIVRRLRDLCDILLRG